MMKGGIVAYPTDTVYGLGCDPSNSRAVKRVMAVKGKRRKPFPILVASQAVADRIAVMDPRAKITGLEVLAWGAYAGAQTESSVPQLTHSWSEDDSREMPR